jgi:hypothetical protein
LGKPGTINVIEDDNQIQRDIIKTHLYYLENVSILNDQERGYFCREYFPYIKAYYLEPLAPVSSVLCDEGKDEVLKVYTNIKSNYEVGRDGE